jgi:hypothetical protein
LGYRYHFQDKDNNLILKRCVSVQIMHPNLLLRNDNVVCRAHPEPLGVLVCIAPDH